MEDDQAHYLWWSSADIRITHPELDPVKTAQQLGIEPFIAQHPGNSKVPHGDCLSAGYLCISHRAVDPERPDAVIHWANDVVSGHELYFRELLNGGCNIDVYIGIHTSVLALGFMFPATPSLWKLGIPLGIEFFSS